MRSTIERLSFLSLLCMGFVAGVAFMVSCGGGSGGTPADGAPPPALAGTVHVAPDTGMGPYEIPASTERHYVHSVMFEPDDPRDIVVTFEGEGTYRVPGLELWVEASTAPFGPALTSDLLTLAGDDATSQKSFHIRLSATGVWLGTPSPGDGPWLVRLMARNPLGIPLSVESVSFRILVLATPTVEEPSPLITDDPYAQDLDGDGHSLYDGDCDESNAEIHPGAQEIPGNGIDDDCDGRTDEAADFGTCGNPIPLEWGTSPYITVFHNDNLSLPAGACGATTDVGDGAPEVVFLLDYETLQQDGGPNSGWRVTVTPSDWDAALYSFAGDCVSGCADLADQTLSGQPETLEIYPSQVGGSDFLIVVDGHGAVDRGEFTIVVELIDP